MSNNQLTPEAIDELLAAVHEELEAGADAGRILAIADANPGARDEVLAFAAEWSLSGGSDLPDEVLDPGHTAREHATLLDRYNLATFAEASPTDASALDGAGFEKLQDVARQCRISLDLLRKLARGRVDELTIPGILIGWIGAELGVEPGAVLSAIASTHASVHLDYFAPSGRKASDRISFLEAVRGSNLDQADRDFWLDKLGR